MRAHVCTSLHAHETTNLEGESFVAGLSCRVVKIACRIVATLGHQGVYARLRRAMARAILPTRMIRAAHLCPPYVMLFKLRQRIEARHAE